MGMRLYVKDQQGELDAVETETEDDFMYFRDSVHLALEHGNFGGRFPVLMETFFSDWESDDVAALERELREIYAAFRQLPPRPPDGNWRAKLRHSGRTPETLAEVYLDRDGAPLLQRLIALAQTARENGLPVRWGESSKARGPGADSASAPGTRSTRQDGNGRVVQSTFDRDRNATRDRISRILLSVLRVVRRLSSHLRAGPDRRLLQAVEAGNLTLARAALASGASPNASATVLDDHSCSSTTPALYTACRRGDVGMVELLLSKGADPNALFERRGVVDFETRSCLAAAIPNLYIVSMLLKAGTDPNLPSTWGEDRTTETSPLAYAKDYPQVEELLRRHGGHE